MVFHGFFTGTKQSGTTRRPKPPQKSKPDFANRQQDEIIKVAGKQNALTRLHLSVSLFTPRSPSYVWPCCPFALARRHAAELQRVYRGFVGRSITAARRAQRKVVKQGLLYASFAEIMQKIWRGYNSRKRKHDYHARKEYIRTIVDKSSELQRRIEEYAEEARKARW